jgi:DNA-binding XRE family transcriptional regulator
MPPFTQRYNNNLKKLLTDNGITQAQLIKESDLSTGTINLICRKKIDPSLKTKEIVVKGLNKLSAKNYTLEEVFS